MPEDDTERRWRVGNHYGIHVYEGDRPVATFHREEDARRAVEAVSRLEELEREVERMEWWIDAVTDYVPESLLINAANRAAMTAPAQLSEEQG